jgi:hypothetical protein
MCPLSGVSTVRVGKLTPNLNTLPPRQRQVWTRLVTTPKDFVLYGGTALALRLGHRESVDFDFFSSCSFQPGELVRSIPYLAGAQITQQDPNTLSCAVPVDEGFVNISFFAVSLNQIETPDLAEDNEIAVASLRDIFGMKCATIPQRNEVKDYRDIHALLFHARIKLADGIAAAAAIYGQQYNPLLTLQALAYFDDLPEPLPASMKADLLSAVKSVSLQNLPAIAATQRIGIGEVT